MKKLLFSISLLLAAAFMITAKAQISSERFRSMKSSWEYDKKIAVNELMQFNEKEANQFWPVYNKYMKEWGKLMNYRITTMEQYCEEIENIKSDRMSQLMNQLFVNDVDLSKLQKKTYKKVRKVLSPSRASQFMQIEYTLRLVLVNEMQQKAMFIGDLTKKL